MQCFSKFYTQLSEDNTIEEGRTKYMDNINIPAILEESKLLCDSPLSTAEIQGAVKCRDNNKTAGPDVIPVAFYKIFLV